MLQMIANKRHDQQQGRKAELEMEAGHQPDWGDRRPRLYSTVDLAARPGQPTEPRPERRPTLGSTAAPQSQQSLAPAAGSPPRSEDKLLRLA